MDRDHELTTTLRNHVLGRDQALKATGKLFFYRRNPLLEIEKETQLFFSRVLIKVAPLDAHGTPRLEEPLEPQERQETSLTWLPPIIWITRRVLWVHISM
jgi:hypothetical protein